MNFNVENCSLDKKTLIEASAGTGKTWTICELYIRLLLEKELETSQILVLTFTNAATAELKQRIRLRIQEGIDDPNLASKKRDILKKAIKTFDESMIYTIHTFCRKLLAQFSFASGKPFSYQVEADNENKALEEVVQDFWRKEIAFSEMDETFAGYLSKNHISPDTFVQFLKRALEKPLAHYEWPKGVAFNNKTEEQKLFLEYKKTKKDVKESFLSLQKMWDSSQNDIKLAFEKGSKFVDGRSYGKHLPTYFEKCEATLKENQPFAANEAFNKLNSDTIQSKGNGKGPVPEHPFFESIREYEELKEQFNNLLFARYCRLLFKLLNWGTFEIRQRQKDNRILALNEMLFQVHDALKQEKENSTLLTALRRTYRAALIDEFQDTDPIQLEIFDSIFPNANAPVFFVGDPKQAIYRFRNADLHTYLKAEKSIQQKAGLKYTLVQNFRSTLAVIDSYNHFFSYREGNPFVLEDVTYHHVSPGKQIDPINDRSSHNRFNTGLVLWSLPRSTSENFKDLKVDDLRAKVARKVSLEIKRLLESSQNILIKGKPLQAKDIAVLVRRKADAKRMQDALSSHNIPSVAASPENSVWMSQESDELFFVLSAISTPKNTSRLRLALSTQLLGFQASHIEELLQDEQAQIEQMDRFMNYLASWTRYGIGFVLKNLLTDYQVYNRYLRLPTAERHLTNLQHLIELLNEAAVTYSSPEALLRYMVQERSEATSTEGSQLRLESDENVIQIMTVHVSKGKEFPIVFCPYLWAGASKDKSKQIQGIERQEEDRLIIDFKSNEGTFSDELNLENLAEEVRLIYVALTRAIYRTYLVCGCYSNTASRQNALNWIVTPEPDPRTWVNNSKDDDKNKSPEETLFRRIENAWEALANSSANIIIEDIDANALDAKVTEQAPTLPKLSIAHTPSASISPTWRIGSYTFLSRDAKDMEEATRGDDEKEPISVILEEDPPIGTTPLSDDDILKFPRSNIAGDFIHSLFETVDFTDSSLWERQIQEALRDKTPYGATFYQKKLENDVLAFMLKNMLGDVLKTPLLGKLSLDQIKTEKRFSELRFYMPTNRLKAEALNTRFQTYTKATYSFNELSGYLNGAIDLVFEYENQFYILDWKSNYLCQNKENPSLEEAKIAYGRASVDEAMVSHHYHLQHLIYTVALNRYLKIRLPNYDYDTHFGGVFYLFIRGVRPDWKNADKSPLGVFYTKTDKKVIEDLDKLIHGDLT